MSLGSVQFYDNYKRTFLDLNEAEREAVMTLANMKYAPATDIWNPLVGLAADLEAKKEHDQIASVVYHVNNTKFSELKDRYLSKIEEELLPKTPTQQAVSPESTPKKSHSKRAAPRQRSSPIKTRTEGGTVMSLAFNRKEIHTTFSVDAQGQTWKASYAETKFASKGKATLNEDPYRKEYQPRQKPRREASITPIEPGTRSRRAQVKSKPLVITQLSNHISSAPKNDAQLLTPKITPVAITGEVTNSSDIDMPNHGYSCNIAMSDAGCSPTATLTSEGYSSTSKTASIPCSPASRVPQATQNRTPPGQTYPELIVRAIKESDLGRLKVSQLYEILPAYNPTIISKLNPSEPSKGGKRKTAEEVFQENVRQNLSRNKSLFRNIKDPESGKSTGFWELVNAQTSPSSPLSSASSSSSFMSPSTCLNSSGPKRKFSQKKDESPSKRAKTAR